MSRFRLPTIEELKTLIHPDKDQGLFGEDGWFWSSSPRVFGTGLAWRVGFGVGDIAWGLKGNSNRVRLVRAGSALAIDDSVDAEAPDRLVDNGDGTHTDRRTGLIWKSQPEVGQFTWNEAMAASTKKRPEPTPLHWNAIGPTITWG